MSSTPAKLAAFAAALAAIFGISILAGAAFGPDREGGSESATASEGTGQDVAR